MSSVPSWIKLSPKLWLHYVLLALLVLYVLPVIKTQFEAVLFPVDPNLWIYVIVVYTIGIGLIDLKIHQVLKVD